jgi:hypothetical protein
MRHTAQHRPGTMLSHIAHHKQCTKVYSISSRPMPCSFAGESAMINSKIKPQPGDGRDKVVGP